MLKSWLTLRHISQAIQAGKLDEAWQLLKEPAIRQQSKTREYRLCCGIGFLARAKKEGKHNLQQALQDLAKARDAGVEESNIELVKNELFDSKLTKVRETLEQGHPAQAIEYINVLRQEQLTPSFWEKWEDMARSWLVAREQAQRGEFTQALSLLEPFINNGITHLAAQYAEWMRYHSQFPKLCDELHQAVEQQQWRKVIPLADNLLGMAPEHAEVRKARAKAWKMLEPPTLVHGAATPAPVKPEAMQPGKHESETPRRLLCWIDGVGGYLLCLASRVSLGRATGDATVDIPLFADVSRLHAYLNRDSEGGYVLEAVRPIQLNGKNTEKALLKDGDILTLGTACRIRFRQPLAVSGTARLELISRHRLPLSMDGVILMADACLMGDNSNTHIVAPGLTRPLGLVRQGDGLAVQCAGPFEVDGQACKGRAAITQKSTITADDVRIKLEPVGPRFLGG
ncbi:MAG TPA: FHA domain-containing protein [Gemmatales bacterium]|nr:FHA domain-containing protein [Gemmatales bacterium]HMP18169.1 FHA domain-containing protein [Gemmatales bacterium]